MPLIFITRRRTALLTLLLAGALAGCGSFMSQKPAPTASALDALLPTQVLLLGEQHDAPEHQQIQAQTVQQLAGRGQLAALVLEMAPAGGSTEGLSTETPEDRVRSALQWDERAWPWSAYGPAVMAAVRAGVPVLGGNLPLSGMRAAMNDPKLEQRLPPATLARQQALVRQGHCGLLPEGQIAPMTRVQIARDLSMAQTVATRLRAARAGQVVMLISGSVHADKALGVPLHLPAGTASVSVRLQAGEGLVDGESFDARWPTRPVAAVDYCAGLAEHFKKHRPGAP